MDRVKKDFTDFTHFHFEQKIVGKVSKLTLQLSCG